MFLRNQNLIAVSWGGNVTSCVTEQRVTRQCVKYIHVSLQAWKLHPLRTPEMTISKSENNFRFSKYAPNTNGQHWPCPFREH